MRLKHPSSFDSSILSADASSSACYRQIRRNPGWVVIILLLLMFGAELTSASHASPTYDEYTYIARGYTYLATGDTRLKLRHPILIDVIAAAPLFLLPDIHLPLDDPGWVAGDFHIYAHVFLWEANVTKADKIVFLARLPIMALSLLLAAGVSRWTRERFGPRSALVATMLCALDPNILAHGRLVTPDVGQTTFMFFAALGWWRYLQRSRWTRWAVAGIMLGLAQAAGFPALLLLPVLAVVSAVHGWHVRRGMGAITYVAALVGAVGLGAFIVWAVYGFRSGPVGALGLSLPAPYYWDEFISLIHRLSRRDLAFCCGRVYRGGWWLFFVVALLVKTPIATLALFGIAIFVMTRRRTWMKDTALWLFPALYYGIALASSLNIGYRHILPVLPFLFTLAGQAAYFIRGVVHRVIVMGLLTWLVLASITIYPFYLAYFNELAGGPEGGKHYLAVSDLDWGQDLPSLSAYLREQRIGKIYLSWFGTTPPEYYGIRYWPLPAWPPRGNPLHFPFHPKYPLPGVYAISVANLEGARLTDPDTFAWFRLRQPEARIGYSVYVYSVPRLIDPEASPVDVALSGVPLSDLPASIFENRFHTNDIHLRWFDARRAIILPSGHAFLVIAPETTPLESALAERLLQRSVSLPELLRTAQGVLCNLYELESGFGLIEPYLRTRAHRQLYVSAVLVPSLTETQLIQTPVQFGEVASFLGYELLTPHIEPGGKVEMLSFWRVDRRTEAPLAIFVHLLSPDGSILGQHDGLDASPEGWYRGDFVVQVHRFDLPTALPEGPLWLELGLYRTDTLDRLPVRAEGTPEIATDRLLLLDMSSRVMGDK